MKITDRYASAVRSSNLRSQENTLYSDTDVLGAVGLAGKANPLATALLRLFSGDNGAAREVVTVLAEMAWDRAIYQNVALKRTQAQHMAEAVLAWHRDGVCRPCNGLGYALIPGAPAVSDVACRHCHGSGKMSLDGHFNAERRVIARWLIAEVEREQAKAGPLAMARLAPRMEL